VKKIRSKLHTNDYQDNWSKVQSNLAEAASEQIQADLGLVVATRALLNAQNAHQAAIARKTKAEAKLNKLRADLGVEV
jgi:hypothetical protein